MLPDYLVAHFRPSPIISLIPRYVVKLYVQFHMICPVTSKNKHIYLPHPNNQRHFCPGNQITVFGNFLRHSYRDRRRSQWYYQNSGSLISLLPVFVTAKTEYNYTLTEYSGMTVACWDRSNCMMPATMKRYFRVRKPYQSLLYTVGHSRSFNMRIQRP